MKVRRFHPLLLVSSIRYDTIVPFQLEGFLLFQLFSDQG